MLVMMMMMMITMMMMMNIRPFHEEIDFCIALNTSIWLSELVAQEQKNEKEFIFNSLSYPWQV